MRRLDSIRKRGIDAKMHLIRVLAVLMSPFFFGGDLATSDLTPISNNSIRSTLNAINMPWESVRQTPVVLYTSKGYIIFSKEISDARVQQWQDALDGLKTSGRYQELSRKYLEPE